MNIAGNLRIERYKMVMDRQKYCTDVARESFFYFIKTFVSLAAGAIALISLKEKLLIQPVIMIQLLNAVKVLVTFLGFIAIAQIFFCLVRWYGFRNTECAINSECPSPEWWACIYELLFIVAIAISIYVVWEGVGQFALYLMTEEISRSR